MSAREITLTEQQFKDLLPHLSARWEPRSIEIAKEGLVGGTPGAQTAKKFGVTRQLVYRVVRDFRNAYIEHVGKLGHFSATAEDFDAITNALLLRVSPQLIVGAFRVMVLGAAIPEVAESEGIDKEELFDAITRAKEEIDINQRVTSWTEEERAAYRVGGLVKVEAWLTPEQARIVAAMERQVSHLIGDLK